MSDSSVTNLRFIFGGTFNPIHFGHLRLLENIHNLARAAPIHVLPCANPGHREAPDVSAEHRMAMVKLATKHSTHLIADDREVKRSGVSYSWLSVQELKQEYPYDTLIWVLGGDAAANFNTWRHWQDIVANVSLLVVDRASHPQNEIHSEVAAKITHCDSFNQLTEHPQGAYWRYNAPLLDISSTQIRHLWAENRSSRFLLPDSVIEYIHQHKIYRR